MLMALPPAGIVSLYRHIPADIRLTGGRLEANWVREASPAAPREELVVEPVGDQLVSRLRSGRWSCICHQLQSLAKDLRPCAPCAANHSLLFPVLIFIFRRMARA